MTAEPERAFGSRRADGVTVMSTTAMGYLVLLVLTAGLPFTLPSGLLSELTGPGPVSVVVPHLVVPLAVIVLVRRPWWVRWFVAGLLLTNVGAIVLLALTTPGPNVFTR